MAGLLQRFGDVDLPVVGADVTDGQLFSALDPGRDAMIAMLTTAINVELAGSASAVTAGSAWAVAAAGTKLAAVLPVADTLYEPPRPGIMRQREVTFPLLALYRTTAEHNEWSLAREQIIQTWGLDYVLGPLDAAAYRRLAGVMNGVRMLVQLIIRRRGHPAYAGGALQFGPGAGRFTSIAITESVEGPAAWGQVDQGHEFYALSMTLVTSELDEVDTDDAPAFAGASIHLGMGSGSEVLPGVIDARTEVVVDPLHPLT